MNVWILIGVLAYLIVREVFYIYSTQKLINKLMSRNYHEFRTAEKVEVPKSARRKEEADEPAEDLGDLNVFIN